MIKSCSNMWLFTEVGRGFVNEKYFICICDEEKINIVEFRSLFLILVRQLYTFYRNRCIMESFHNDICSKVSNLLILRNDLCLNFV